MSQWGHQLVSKTEMQLKYWWKILYTLAMLLETRSRNNSTTRLHIRNRRGAEPAIRFYTSTPACVLAAYVAKTLVMLSASSFHERGLKSLLSD